MKTLKILAALFLVAGAAALVRCSRTPKYEVDFTYDILRKSPTGEIVETGLHSSVFHIASEDGKGGLVERMLSPNAKPDQTGSPDPDGFGIRVDSVTSTDAVFRVTFPDGTQTNLHMQPKAPKEQFDPHGTKGIRLVIDQIRIRNK